MSRQEILAFPEDDYEFPTVIDSSIMESFATCMRKGYWAHIRGKVPAGINPHLNAGGAYAKGMEVFRKAYYSGETFEVARVRGFIALTKEYGKEDPEQTSKQWKNVVLAYLFYFLQYPPDKDKLKPHMHNGEPWVEFSFAVPLNLSHPKTGEPLIYAGRVDMIATIESVLYIVDDKTTGQLGATWADQWRLRGQMTGYSFAAKQHAVPAVGVIIRGTSIQKTQNKFIEAITFREDWKVNRWLTNLEILIERVKDNFLNKTWPTDGELNNACAAYGGCPYRRLCESPQPEEWLHPYFQNFRWNPLDRKKELEE